MDSRPPQGCSAGQYCRGISTDGSLGENQECLAGIVVEVDGERRLGSDLGFGLGSGMVGERGGCEGLIERRQEKLISGVVGGVCHLMDR